jgi:hypothetical protein
VQGKVRDYQYHSTTVADLIDVDIEQISQGFEKAALKLSKYELKPLRVDDHFDDD